MKHTPGSVPLLEVRVFRRPGIILVLGFLLGVQVVQVAEELVEAVHSRQELVLVAEMVLPELARGVPERFEQFRDGRVLRLETDIGAGHADLGQARADRVLAGDERGPARRAALLPVVVGEGDPLVGDAVDVGRPVAHLAPVVVADVPPADVVAPQDQDVGLLCCHLNLLLGVAVSASRSYIPFLLSRHGLPCFPWHRLNFSPLPQKQGSFRPIFPDPSYRRSLSSRSRP